MDKCIDCKKQNHCAERRGSHKYCFVPKNQTNYDRIRDMSVDEMATFLQEVEYRRAFDGGGAKWESKGTVIEWLEREGNL